MRCSIAGCLLGLSLLGGLPAQTPESIAILDLEGRGISAIEAASLTDRLRAALVRTRAVTIVERGQMEQILSEQDFQITGCTSDECAVEVGQLLGVTIMVAGSIGRVGATYSVDIRTIDVQTGRIGHSLWRDYRGEIDGLLAIMPEIANELVAAIGTIPEPAPEPARPAPALLVIQTDPGGATIALDGDIVGETPLDSLEVKPNTAHLVSAMLEGYRAGDTTVVALEGQVYALTIPLRPLPSRLSVSSTPAGARIILDGNELGATPVSSIDVDGNQTHSAEISLANYRQVDTTFFTAADRSHELHIALRPLPGSLSIRSTPSRAIVRLNRQPGGRTPLDLSGLPAGSQFDVSLTLRGYLPVDTSFIAQPGERHVIDVVLRPEQKAVAVETEAEQPAVTAEKKGRKGFWAVVGLLAATGYYGYTEGWFGEPPADEELRVGNPPSVPAP